MAVEQSRAWVIKISKKNSFSLFCSGTDKLSFVWCQVEKKFKVWLKAILKTGKRSEGLARYIVTSPAQPFLVCVAAQN